MADATLVSTPGSGSVTRREFLYYIWGASMALFAAQFGGLLVWFLIPRFREGEFGGKIPVEVVKVPPINSAPVNVPDGRFWLVNVDTTQPNDLMYRASDEPEDMVGVLAIYKVCTHLGCIYAWTPTNSRFECPCHGSKYRLDGRRVESPAPRTLDRFRIEALAADKTTVLAESPEIQLEGVDFYGPLVLPPDTALLKVNTGDRRKGPSQTLLCSFKGECP